jgi:hypothetical protein
VGRACRPAGRNGLRDGRGEGRGIPGRAGASPTGRLSLVPAWSGRASARRAQTGGVGVHLCQSPIVRLLPGPPRHDLSVGPRAGPGGAIAGPGGAVACRSITLCPPREHVFPATTGPGPLPAWQGHTGPLAQPTFTSSHSVRFHGRPCWNHCQVRWRVRPSGDSEMSSW